MQLFLGPGLSMSQRFLTAFVINHIIVSNYVILAVSQRLYVLQRV